MKLRSWISRFVSFCFVLATPRCLWDLSPLTGGQTCALNRESVESQPLDRQGNPRGWALKEALFFIFNVEMKLVRMILT